MASPPATARPEQPHLVSLVLQSKKALQHGEQLCSRANNLSRDSAQSAVDVLALDAKVRWITEAVLEQLKLAASVARTIEEKRAHLGKQVQGWDVLRVKHSDALDTILDSLGTQLVPPDFHQSSADSSLFGSQHLDDEEHKPNGHTDPHLSPTATLRNVSYVREAARADRQKWKTLRDFVDDQAIEDVLETMENDRTALEDILRKTDDYPETLNNTISSIRDSLPNSTPMLSVNDTLTAQDTIMTSMAVHLESLASHYDQMASALRDSEAGESFSGEDIQDMNRDTNELPSIMTELEESVQAIEMHREELLTGKDGLQKHLNHIQVILDDLDELGDIMSEMLENQEGVEVRCEEELSRLQQHLLTLGHLHERFVCYQTAFSKLILEMARRRQYREAAENIVRGMMDQLQAMTEEENQVRNHFNSEHGAHLPEDICLSIANAPTKWEVLPWNGDGLEVLPDIAPDLITQAKDRIGNAEGTGTESL